MTWFNDLDLYEPFPVLPVIQLMPEESTPEMTVTQFWRKFIICNVIDLMLKSSNEMNETESFLTCSCPTHVLQNSKERSAIGMVGLDNFKEIFRNIDTNRYQAEEMCQEIEGLFQYYSSQHKEKVVRISDHDNTV